jgi:hypothetical protein
MSPAETLAALRAGGAAAERAKVALAHTGEPNEREEHARLRAEVARLLAGSLRPGEREIARWLLEHEIATHEAAGHGAREALYTLIAAVARYADPDDALLIWRARTATPATRAGVDVEQAARAGVERVRRRLRALVAAGGPRARAATDALEWLDEGVASGAASDLPDYFAWADERFGVRVAGPT